MHVTQKTDMCTRSHFLAEVRLLQRRRRRQGRRAPRHLDGRRVAVGGHLDRAVGEPPQGRPRRHRPGQYN